MTGQERRGKYRNRWRQMIAQEENEITTRAGKVKSVCGGKSDGYDEMGSGEDDRMTNREEKNVCCHGLRVYTAFHFI